VQDLYLMFFVLLIFLLQWACVSLHRFDSMAAAAVVDLAMMKKPVGECRTPTDLWAGLGFSKSMPDAEIRDWLDKSLCYRGSGMSTTYEVLNSQIAITWKLVVHISVKCL